MVEAQSRVEALHVPWCYAFADHVLTTQNNIDPQNHLFIARVTIHRTPGVGLNLS
jgi:hypothetical protein